MAKQAVAVYGLPRDVDPHVALLEELHRTAGHVDWLSRRIAAFERADELKQLAAGAGGATWERPAVWVELYQAERRHLAAVAKVCIEVGVEERRVSLAERQGALVAEAIRGILTDLGVVDRPDAAAVVRRHLTLVVSGEQPPPDLEQR
jgi:hypothetical protein